jgi:hypothetical protein
MKLILKTSTRTYVSTYICKYNNQQPARCNIYGNLMVKAVLLAHDEI